MTAFSDPEVMAALQDGNDFYNVSSVLWSLILYVFCVDNSDEEPCESGEASGESEGGSGDCKDDGQIRRSRRSTQLIKTRTCVFAISVLKCVEMRDIFFSFYVFVV